MASEMGNKTSISLLQRHFKKLNVQIISKIATKGQDFSGLFLFLQKQHCFQSNQPMKKHFFTLVGVCFLATTLYSQKTLIHCGNLIDAVKSESQSQMTVVIEGKKIVAIEKGFSSPSGTDKVIDLKSQTVMPGLVDMHVHLEN